MYVNVIIILLIYFVFTSIWIGKYEQITRWWVSSLGLESLQSYNSIASDYNLFYNQPTHLSQPPLWIVILTSYLLPPPISSIRRYHLTLCTYATQHLYRHGTTSTWTFPTPAICQPPLIVSVP